MNYRCLTCGFAQDFAPTSDSVLLHHPWMANLSVLQCPSCTKYLATYGGRKNDKTLMPNITTPGTLVDEATITEELAEMNQDFNDIALTDSEEELARLKAKYEGKLLFGFSFDDIRKNAGK